MRVELYDYPRIEDDRIDEPIELAQDGLHRCDKLVERWDELVNSSRKKRVLTKQSKHEILRS